MIIFEVFNMLVLGPSQFQDTAPSTWIISTRSINNVFVEFVLFFVTVLFAQTKQRVHRFSEQQCYLLTTSIVFTGG
jgi:hypothetical protein